jgi:hypothetical protein
VTQFRRRKILVVNETGDKVFKISGLVMVMVLMMKRSRFKRNRFYIEDKMVQHNSQICFQLFVCK